jgi:hypothetical protein
MTILPNDTSPQRRGAKLAAGLGLVLAIAGSLAPPDGRSTEGLATRVSVPLPDWLVIASVAALSISSLTFIAMVWSQRRRLENGKDEEELQQAQQISPVLTAFSLLLALAPPALLVWATIAQPDGSVIWQLLTGVPLSHVLAQFDAEPAVPASPVTTGLIGTIALLAGFGSLALVLWFRFDNRLHRRPGIAALPHAPIANAVADSLEDLRREADARIAIIKIYGNFERALAGADMTRRPWQTPVEFMHSALARMPLPASAVAGITRLFELARFSHYRLGAGERDSAWRSLIEIRDALDRQKQASDANPS